MKHIHDFEENSDYNNRIIQMALREIETEVLTPALLELDEAMRKVIFRNMSPRAVEMIQEEMREAEGNLPRNAGRQGLDVFEHHLNIYHRFMRDEPNRAADAAAHFPDTSFSEDPKEFLLRFSYFIQMHPPLALEGFVDRAPHPGIAKAMQLMINGHSPESLLEIMAEMKRSAMRRTEREYDLILTTLESFASKQHPRLLKDRLEVM